MRQRWRSNAPCLIFPAVTGMTNDNTYLIHNGTFLLTVYRSKGNSKVWPIQSCAVIGHYVLTSDKRA